MAEGDGIDEKEVEAKASAMNKLKAATQGVAGSLSNVSNAAAGFFEKFGGLNLSISSIISFGLEIDKARAEMAKATGAAEGLGSAMAASREHTQGLAIRFEELSRHTTTAYQNIAIFSEASVKSQGAMLGATAALTKLGVGAEVTAKNINTMTKGLGMSGEEAAKLNMDIAKVSKSLGSFMTPGKMAQEFSNAAPKLAAYGKDMKQEFFKLASQAKATGMEMSGLLGVAGKFDTFEDAANTTAQLNALMGTQLNSVDMLTASEGERIEMLKESVAASGKSWETMDRFERKALAGAVGMSDLAEAGKLFGTSMEDMDEAQEAADPALVKQEELNDSMKRGVSIQEGWLAMLEGIKMKLVKKIMPLVMRFFTWMTSAPKGQKSPLDHMVDAMLSFIGLVEEYLIKPFDTFWQSLDEGEQGMTAKIMGIVLALGPIISIVTTIVGVVTTVGGVFGSIITVVGGVFSAIGTVVGIVMSLGGAIFGVIQFALGVVAAIVGWPVTIALALAALVSFVMFYWEEISALTEEYVIGPFNKIYQIVGSLPAQFPRIFAALSIAWTKFKTLLSNGWQWLKDLFSTAGDIIAAPFIFAFGEVKNVVVSIINWLIDKLNFVFSGMLSMVPDVVLNMLDMTQGDNLIEPMAELHQGGTLAGPAKIKNDEYVIIPPKGAAPGEVMTPQQMGNTDSNPVTVVINIDGREFVRQTVMPALNKEFNLQGIG